MNISANKGCSLFLDFDGVICNSIHECFVSSWFAYFGAEELSRSIPLEVYRTFVSLRPFIRRGGDYLILQYCIHHDKSIRSQSDFDRVLADLGEGVSDEYHRRFYDAREYLLKEMPEYWLRLNPLYDAVSPHLPALSATQWIVTTKSVSFTQKILDFHAISWPVERIICSGKERKLDIIENHLSSGGSPCAVLLDDQIDHLVPSTHADIVGVLAGWGYVKREWVESGSVPVLEYAEVGEFLSNFL